MLPSRPRLTVAVITCVAGALFAPVPGYAARLVAELRPSRIYVGTQTLLIVEVIDARDAGWPSVPSVAGLDIERYGRPSAMRDLFTGRTTRRYQFIVTPTGPGTYEIPKVSLKAGRTTLTDGPLTLRVEEAQLRFRMAEIDPTEILVGETATLDVYYQGVRPGVRPVVPVVDGLVIRPVQLGRVEVTEREGLPITILSFEDEAKKLGSFQISGIQFVGDDITAVTLSDRFGTAGVVIMAVG